LKILCYKQFGRKQVFCIRRCVGRVLKKIGASTAMLRIIIADDHIHIRKGIVQLLEDEFGALHTEEAENGIELFDKVMTAPWDLVISDMVMPGGNGLEALKKIKKEKKELPVIIVSTYPAEQYKSRVMEAGADDFISKDAFSTHLIPSIRRILKN